MHTIQIGLDPQITQTIPLKPQAFYSSTFSTPKNTRSVPNPNSPSTFQVRTTGAIESSKPSPVLSRTVVEARKNAFTAQTKNHTGMNPTLSQDSKTIADRRKHKKASQLSIDTTLPAYKNLPRIIRNSSTQTETSEPNFVPSSRTKRANTRPNNYTDQATQTSPSASKNMSANGYQSVDDSKSIEKSIYNNPDLS